MSRPEDEYPNRERKYPNAESSAEAPSSEDFQAERGLDDLSQGRWAAAEQRFTAALTRAAGRPRVQALSVVGVAQSRLFGRRDARGAFAMLQTLLGQEAQLAPVERVRVHLVAAFLFADDEPSVHDRQRALRHAHLARLALTGVEGGELAALCAVIELLLLAFDAEATVFSEQFRAREGELLLAASPVTRCLVLEVEAMQALAEGDSQREAARLGQAVEEARRLGFAAAEARLLLRAARRTLRACVPDERSGPVVSQRVAVDPVPAALELGLAPSLEATIRKLAPSRVTVLLVGESARLIASVARALHDHGGRAEHPFVTVDCRRQSAGGMEVWLFGGPEHAGAGRGAVHESGRGTLHVAGVDALPLLIQPRFLRFLDEDKRVRVVASTSVDLRDSVERGVFRRDLGERLTLVQLSLPGEGRSV